MLFFRIFIKVVLVFSLISLSNLSHSHHSFSATFTDQVITVEGVVERYRFVNPHVMIHFVVRDEQGFETEWITEGLSAATMRRRGWGKDSLKQGDYIRVTGNTTRNGSPMVSTESLELIDPVTGNVLKIPGQEVAQGTTTSTTPTHLDDGRPNLTGTWQRITRGRPDDPSGAPFNEVGAALQAAFDPINDPQVQCEPPGLVRQAAATPHAVRLTQYHDHILIEYEEYGGVRKIYFNHPVTGVDEDNLLSHLGKSIAHYRDQKLVIETTGLLANLSGTNGLGLSDRTSTIETYYRNTDDENGSSLTMEMIITDPKYLEAPWRLSWQKYFVEGHEFLPVDCQKPLAY